MTVSAPRTGIDHARPDSDRAASSIWWRGCPLEVEARHFVMATAEVSGLSPQELSSRMIAAPLVTWRRLGMAAAARCGHLSGPTVAEAFVQDASLVAQAKAWATLAAQSDPTVAERIVQIQGWAMAHAISELSGFKR